MSSIKRILGLASGGQTSRVSTPVAGEQTQRVDGIVSAGETVRVSDAPDAQPISRVAVLHYLLLEGDESGRLSFEGDVQSGSLLIARDMAIGPGENTRRITL
jgi:hypothetical protein